MSKRLPKTHVYGHIKIYKYGELSHIKIDRELGLSDCLIISIRMKTFCPALIQNIIFDSMICFLRLVTISLEPFHKMKGYVQSTMVEIG